MSCASSSAWRPSTGTSGASRRSLTSTSGAEAKQLNLVTQVSDEPLVAAEALAGELMTRSPDAVAAAKSLFQRSWFASVRRAFAIESGLQFRLLRGANQRIAMRANFARKAPLFRSRSFKD